MTRGFGIGKTLMCVWWLILKLHFFIPKSAQVTLGRGGINTHLLQFYYLYYLLCKQLNIKQQLKGQREFWAAIRIEIKFLLPWVVQNKLLGLEMLVKIWKHRLTPWLLYFKTPILDSEVILQHSRNIVLYFLNNKNQMQTSSTSQALIYVLNIFQLNVD